MYENFPIYVKCLQQAFHIDWVVYFKNFLPISKLPNQYMKTSQSMWNACSKHFTSVQWIARSQNMGSNLDPDLLPKKRSDPIPIRSFPIFHWRSFQIFSDPFRSFPIYQPWVFTIFIIVKIYFNNMFGNWYMSKISMHQNIYHLYLILEKLAQKMEKNKNS